MTERIGKVLDYKFEATDGEVADKVVLTFADIPTAAQLVGMSVKQLRRLIKAGDLPAVDFPVGKKFKQKVKVEDLKKFMSDRESEKQARALEAK